MLKKIPFHICFNSKGCLHPFCKKSNIHCCMQNGERNYRKNKVYSCGYPITSMKLSILSPLSRVSRIKSNRPARLLRPSLAGSGMCSRLAPLSWLSWLVLLKRPAHLQEGRRRYNTNRWTHTESAQKNLMCTLIMRLNFCSVHSASTYCKSQKFSKLSINKKNTQEVKIKKIKNV